MDQGHDGVPGREQRLDEVVTAYLKDLEAGCDPDRGGLLARHPDLAADLAQFFEDQDALGGLATPARARSAAVLAEGQPPAWDPAGADRLGDFRIIREVGRGGMGV